ncbi:MULTISPECIES: murein hydrolase activator EnvC family protein [unclassified Novosphingobium]|uniref:murein hydrolase activator EnvC family protein n=2 Tax=unclassified Novosphingobium TaxID=2644732 RepID=UPI00086DE96F|nr:MULTISPECIES: peptidoglycan DD-metalloendopeptidase family protein [unclassified Novosphingobium]MDR6705793.1 septal ring factor EnvC (AmiA/AmiB activator) [Novosphingobium sp. 1748]ODU85115.1 MAG: metalloendopeptidase [Novosphingobium sp. SCN 63-17]OJX89108.1 MAG: metalloendopeptidase [Novosphingobium sp. 63-713]
MRAGVLLMAALLAPLLASAAGAQGLDDPAQTRRDLAAAQAQAGQARARAERLDHDAQQATAAADKAAKEAAALAARIQEAEAQIVADEARIRIIETQRRELRAQLAQRQKPLVELTGALQRLSRRPPLVALLRPGSLADSVHTRALLESMLPQVQRRTAALRSELARARALQEQAKAAEAALHGEIAALGTRRRDLGAMEARQRQAAREANGGASREAERALALAEKARDLGGLLDGLEQAAALRDRLAALPGPVLRPAPGSAGVGQMVNEAAYAPSPSPTPTALPDFLLPVTGRLVSGFGDASRGTAARGITLSVRAQAQVVAPSGGRIAFAGPFAGYGQIIIIDHPGGFTSLITGLERISAQVGDNVVAGSPLGAAGGGRPQITLELRRDGRPVNPLDQLHH